MIQYKYLLFNDPALICMSQEKATMKGNPKQDDPLIQNLHDAGCSQQIIEQFMQSRKEGNIFCQMHILVKQRNLLLEDLHKDQNKLDCLDYLLFQLKKGC